MNPDDPLDEILRIQAIQDEILGAAMNAGGGPPVLVADVATGHERAIALQIMAIAAESLPAAMSLWFRARGPCWACGAPGEALSLWMPPDYVASEERRPPWQPSPQMLPTCPVHGATPIDRAALHLAVLAQLGIDPVTTN